MRVRPSRVFLQSAARDFKRTGAIAPSSTALGQAMTSELVRLHKNPVRILEVGGGTGSITRVIARQIRPGDHLDVYEIDAAFAGVINQRLKQDKSFKNAREAISVHNQAIESIDRAVRYDFIISCLPFTNFDPDTVREIFEIYRNLLNPCGVCSFFEYALLRDARRFMPGKPDEKERVSGVARVVEEYVGRYSYRRDLVLFNLPPAIVHHIRFDDSNAARV